MDYKRLTACYEAIDKTTKRLQKTAVIVELLKELSPKEYPAVLLLLQGRIFPVWSQQKIGMAAKLVAKAISIATGMTIEEIEQEWKKIGDLGDVAEQFVGRKRQATLFSESLTVAKVFSNAQKISTMEGGGSTDRKIKLVAELLTSATPVEAKYVVRMVLEDLRVGIGEGTLRDAICWTYIYPVEYDKEKNDLILDDAKREEYKVAVNIVQEALDLTNDFAEVLLVAKENGSDGLRKLNLESGKPLKVMLYKKVKDVDEALETLGEPCAFEYKLDGFRLQVHKSADGIKLFTRRLENVTKQFPDVVRYVENHIEGESFILDAEAVGYDLQTKKYLPFQFISQRIRRKYDIADMVKKFPIELTIFDILYLDGESTIKKGFLERRNLLEKIVKGEKLKIVLVPQIITSDKEEAREFFQRALDSGMEGLMGKKLNAIYKPGSRVGYGVKIKTVLDPLDVVVVGAEWGEGKRTGWFTSFMVACNDNGVFKEIGKVGTGFKEKEDQGGVTFSEMTKRLKKLVIKEEGREVTVKPELVITLKFEEIQTSPTYRSGYALRFPRMVLIRDEKPVAEIVSLEEMHERFEEQ